MNKNIIEEIKNRMCPFLEPSQMTVLEIVLSEIYNVDVIDDTKDYVKLFLSAKNLEGKSKRTVKYYTQILRSFEMEILHIKSTSTEEIRSYLNKYQKRRNCSVQTIDNIRRVLSSFFSWMENENYILKNPMKRICKVKIPIKIKPIYLEEELIAMRDYFMKDKRNLAIFDLLTSSGIRVGELVLLNRKDLNIEKQCAIVYGKGAKERNIYFDTKTKLSLKRYLDERDDNEEALFVTKRKYCGKTNYRRLSINQIESLIRNGGKLNNNINAHPHKFRRTLATKAIDKGMPIEQVQVLLGHAKIDTTLVYAQVQQRNVRYAYHKYIV